MIQSGELLVILLLALVVLGPQRLPDMARKLGGWTRELRTAAREISRGLEAEVKEIKDVRNEIRGSIDEVRKPLRDMRDDMAEAYEWKGPKPVSGPTPADAMRDYEELNRIGEDSSTEDSSNDPSSHPAPVDPESEK